MTTKKVETPRAVTTRFSFRVSSINLRIYTYRRDNVRPKSFVAIINNAKLTTRNIRTSIFNVGTYFVYATSARPLQRE